MNNPQNPFLDPTFPQTRPTQDLVEQAKKVLNAQSMTSRDHRASFGDEDMLKIMAQSWSAWDQWFNQMQRDMARLPVTEGEAHNLNALMLAFSQIVNRTLEAVEEGQNLLALKDEARTHIS